MGTKGGKPLSAIEKRQLKAEKREEKKPVKEKEEKGRALAVDPSLIKKVAEDVKNASFITTFSLVQKYGIKYSIAKKILKHLAVQNIVSIPVKTRRIMVATPVKGSTS